MKLLILGDVSKYDNALSNKLDSYKYNDDVVLINAVNESEIQRILAASYTTIFLPTVNDNSSIVLQCQYLQVPLILSSVKSNKEVANALYIDANIDNNELAQQMILIYKDEQLKTKLSIGIDKEKLELDDTEMLQQFSTILTGATF